jgi:alpha-tubulin suppressor-like RCC1 family protein
VVRIAANALRSLVLRDDGQVLVWGHTSGGVSTLPAGLSNVVEIAAGVMHNLALRGDGSVVAWGHNWSGHDITPPESATNVVAIAAGMFHSLALRADGTIVGWGNNRAGQIVIPASATNLVSIAAGFNFSAGLRADGTVVAWGELPINPSLRATYSCGGHSMSVGVGSVTNDLIALPAAATNIVALAAGREHLLMLRADGALIFAGNKDHGQDEVGFISNVIGIAAGGNQNLALTGLPALRLGGHQTNRIAAVGAPVVLNPAVGGMFPRGGWRWQSPGGNFEPDLPYRFLAATTAEDQGEFQFVVTNAFGALTGAISLTLTASPPRLLTQPASQFAVAGSDVSFSVMAAGTMPLSYQWQRNETNLTDGLELTGATTPRLTLLNVQSDVAANYRVMVTNSQGIVTSSNAALVVFGDYPLAVALDAEDLVWTTGGPGGWRWQSDITSDGVDAAETGPYLEDQTNWVETTVTGPTTVSFWWRAFGWITDRFSFSVNGVERMAVANDFNWQQRSYYLPAGTHTLRWTYVCEPVGGTSTAWLDQVVLTNAILPLLTTQPTSRSVLVGANTTFTAAAAGTEPFNYQWRFNGADMPGATNATLTLSQVQPAQAGNYTIVVSNVVGVGTSQVAVLTVNDSMPTIQFTSSLLTAAPGTAPSFSSIILGSTPMNIVWQRNQQNLPDTASSSLVLSNLQPAQAGKYRVVAANAFGTAFSSEAELFIVPVATWGSSIVQARVPAHVGDVVGLAGGFNHSVALRRDGTVVYWGNYQAITSFTSLAGENQLVAVAAANNHDLGLRADGTVLAFGNITSYGLGDIPAEATNIVAIATSGQHNLALRADGNVVSWGDNQAGLLTVPPDATNLVAISAAVGYSLALRDTGELRAWGRNDFGQLNVPAGNDYLAVAAGYRHAVALREDGTVVAWGENEYGQTNVPPGLSNVVAIATRNYHTLALRQDGKVFAWGQNTLGQTDIWPTLTNVVGIAAGSSHSLALVGDGRPVINLPPLRRRIESGADAVLRVLATGAGPLHYQWQHDGTNIPGATNATLLVRGGGNYSVTVSNQLGQVDSPSVPVIVTPPALRFDSAPGAVQLLADGLHLRLLGASGRGPIVVLASADFIAWTSIRTNPPVVGEWTFVDAAATNLSQRFYRAVEMESPVLLPLQFIAPVYANTPTGGWFRATLTGLSGSGPVTILGSSNLVDWQSVLTNGPVAGEWEFEHVQPGPPTLFWYRASEQR